MPNLKSMMERGVHGNLATLRPVLSPMLWTSIATGKRAYKHGIHGFIEPTPDGSSVRPITNLSRKTKAIWNILNQQDKRSIVVSWWPSFPAEPINGVMVSNQYNVAGSLGSVARDEQGHVRAPEGGWGLDDWPMMPGTVHPTSMARKLQEFRFHPLELTAEQCAPFIPKVDTIDPSSDERILAFMKILAETISVHGAGTSLLQLEPWDFGAVYFDAIDHFGHGFMRYHPPRLPWVTEEDFELYKGVVEGAYRLHDQMLGVYLELAGKDATVILVSDHGFHPDQGRLRTPPPHPAGPAEEHRRFGVFVACGPGLKQGEEVFGLNLLDIAPTVLTAFGLPVGDDMDGRAITEAWMVEPDVQRIPSWDDIDGESGMHPPGETLDPVASAETMRHLVDLGYVDPPADDVQEQLDECGRELRFNLAQDLIDAALHADAALILEQLWDDWPDEHRFAVHLLGCFESLGWMKERSDALALFEQRISESRERAIESINELRPEAARYGIAIPDPTQQGPPPAEGDASEPETLKEDPPRRLVIVLRRLFERLSPRTAQLSWLRLKQVLMEGSFEEARSIMDDLSKSGHIPLPMAGQFAKASLLLGDAERALVLNGAMLREDPEAPDAHLGIAEAHLALGAFEDALDAALTSVELEAYNPGAHHIIGHALMELGRYDDAERALKTAIRQAPGYAGAHRLIARLYKEHLDRELDACRHQDIVRRGRDDRVWVTSLDRDRWEKRHAPEKAGRTRSSSEATVASDLNPGSLITIVSGLPRSGTSMMMQMLRAGGMQVCADDSRTPDIDNPAGYLEDQRVKGLRTDRSWIPEVRGQAIKVIAQLLPCLPEDQDYYVIFMRRDINEIVRSQQAMLERLGRSGARLTDPQLKTMFEQHIDAVMEWTEARPRVRMLEIDYETTLRDTSIAVAAVRQFLPHTLDDAPMEAAILPTLRRQGS